MMSSVPVNLSLIDHFDAHETLPLEHSWSFWHDKFIGPGLSAEEYEASLQKLCTFSTVQDFWKCYNNLPPIEKLRFKSSFHIMKAGVAPLWEDPKNADGGFWSMRINKEETAYVWKEVVLALIGEQFDEALADGDEICGFTVSIRQHDNIIRVWNTNASAHSTGLLDRLKAIIPKVEIRSPYYKANQEHTGFSKEFFEKAAKKATD